MNKMNIKSVLTILLLFLAKTLWAQTVYTGFIGKYPIELVTEIYSDGVARAIYTYTKFDTPISIDGELEDGVLNLYERNASGEVTATLVFDKFKQDSEILNGKWRNEETAKKLNIELRKMYEIASGDEDEDEDEWTGRELIQRGSLQNYYFKLQLSKTDEDYYPRIFGIKMIEKKTDKLVQELSLDAESRGIDSISIGDYNFDGVDDYSVFETGYAGSNTSSLYFLYNPQTGHFFESGFSGTSLTFDPDSKTINERNECCAGTSVTTTTYTVENNKMVIIDEHCYRWDDEKEDLTERKMEECQ